MAKFKLTDESGVAEAERIMIEVKEAAEAMFESGDTSYKDDESDEDAMKRRLLLIQHAIHTEKPSAEHHIKEGHDTPEGFAKLYDYHLSLVQTCVSELKLNGHLE